jgi:hypothetical protein
VARWAGLDARERGGWVCGVVRRGCPGRWCRRMPMAPQHRYCGLRHALNACMQRRLSLDDAPGPFWDLLVAHAWLARRPAPSGSGPWFASTGTSAPRAVALERPPRPAAPSRHRRLAARTPGRDTLDIAICRCVKESDVLCHHTMPSRVAPAPGSVLRHGGIHRRSAAGVYCSPRPDRRRDHLGLALPPAREASGVIWSAPGDREAGAVGAER